MEREHEQFATDNIHGDGVKSLWQSLVATYDWLAAEVRRVWRFLRVRVWADPPRHARQDAKTDPIQIYFILKHQRDQYTTSSL